MTNYEKLTQTFPNIPDHSGLDIWGDFWDEEYQEPKEGNNDDLTKESMRKNGLPSALN